MTYHATKAAVDNQGVPPDNFLDQLVLFGKTAPDEIFAPRPAPNMKYDPDIYAHIVGILGPWSSLLHRKGAMLETLRVLAGFESSWNWKCGVDVTNHHSVTHIEGQETGAFQVSYDSLPFDPSLGICVAKYVGGPVKPQIFIDQMKAQPQFAIEYCARLLRFSITWDGPLRRGDVQRWLSKDAVAEFMALISL